jgi:hypothetical protein
MAARGKICSHPPRIHCAKALAHPSNVQVYFGAIGALFFFHSTSHQILLALNSCFIVRKVLAKNGVTFARDVEHTA